MRAPRQQSLTIWGSELIDSFGAELLTWLPNTPTVHDRRSRSDAVDLSLTEASVDSPLVCRGVFKGTHPEDPCRANATTLL